MQLEEYRQRFMLRFSKVFSPAEINRFKGELSVFELAKYHAKRLEAETVAHIGWYAYRTE